jgi:3-hydroxy-9,10-secoandrosta-1,3,5(10)-triene-9,17-dione monooxygenase reductase component
MVKTGSRSWSAVQAGGRFTANILASDQRQLSQVLAGWSPDKFRDVVFDDEQTEALVIRGCTGWADCQVERAYHRTLRVEESRAPGWA